MSEKVQKRIKPAGKVSSGIRRVPEEIDMTDLVYLEYRDITRIADGMQLRHDYVARVKRGEAYNVKVLAALLKKARENKKALMG